MFDQELINIEGDLRKISKWKQETNSITDRRLKRIERIKLNDLGKIFIETRKLLRSLLKILEYPDFHGDSVEIEKLGIVNLSANETRSYVSICKLSIAKLVILIFT